MSAPSIPTREQAARRLQELQPELARPEALAEALALRGLLDGDHAADDALRDCPAEDLRSAALWPHPRHVSRLLEGRGAPGRQPALDDQELALEALEVLEAWGLRAEGLGRLGEERLADQVEALRLAAYEELRAWPAVLLAAVEDAVAAAASSPLGPASAWALLVEDTGAADFAVPRGGWSDLELVDFLTGLAAPELAEAVAAAQDTEPRLASRLARLEAELVSFDAVPGEAGSQGDWGPPPAGQLVPFPPAGARVVSAVPARAPLDELVYGAAAASSEAAPELDPPQPDALLWIFAGGARLFVEQARERWFVRLQGVEDPGAIVLSGGVLARWDAQRSLVALLEAGELEVVVAGEVVRTLLPEV